MADIKSLFSTRRLWLILGLVPVLLVSTAVSFGTSSKAQTISGGRPQIFRAAVLNNFKLLRVAGNTYRIDTKTGLTERLMMSSGYEWTALREPDAVAVSEFDICEISGESMIRVDCKTGKTWVLTTKYLAPEWKLVVK